MALSFQQKLKSLVYVTTSAFGIFSAISIYKEDENFYKKIIMPMVHLLDAEQAHKLAIFISKYRILPRSHYKDPENLKINVFGKQFENPIGIAAGFDKHGEGIIGLKNMGFGFIEIGSITPLPQPGNDKPRVFRLADDMAIINRYGFNSEGYTKVLQRLKNIKAKSEIDNIPIIGVNLGKNKTASNAIKDFVDGIRLYGPNCDYLVINISSPNTPNLRQLQNKENLKLLLEALISARNSLEIEPKPPLLLKLAPDLNDKERKDIADIINQSKYKVDGLIICNTTIERPESLKSDLKNEIGGLSGKPLKDISTNMLMQMSKLTNGIPIIGVGGITSGKDAYEKIRAGASLIQFYSVLIYEGPPVVTRIKKELSELLEKDGFQCISEAIGADIK